MRVVLIHSPLVGPATLAPLAASLEELGWTARLPDLRAGVASPSRFASTAAGQPGADVVVGHSGAGPFLPTVARAVGATATVFVDAIVPPAEDVYAPAAGLLALLDSLPVVDGALPAWHEWWPPRVLEELVPAEAQRAAMVAEMPRVPRAFFDEVVPLPARWWTGPAAYLQLTAGYADDRARAATWGWPTDRLDGTHLDPATRPDIVAARLIDLTARLHGTG